MRPEHIASLGTVGDPATIAERVAFWGNLHRRLAALSNRISAKAQGKIIGAIHARIPIVTVDEQAPCNARGRRKTLDGPPGCECLTRPKAKRDLWTWRRVKAAVAEASAAQAAEKAAAAKDRLDRLAKGEDVSGGLGKPMTRKDYDKILMEAGRTADDVGFSVELAALHGEEEFDAFMRESCEVHRRAE